MKVLIIEDELPAASRLQRLLKETDKEVQVLEVIDSIESGIEWFAHNEAPDLILSDIQLSDGLSLELLTKVPLKTPVIFTTAYDEYAIDAFKLNSIDYLLKPVNTEDLRRAIQKYKTLQQPFTTQPVADMKQMLQRILHRNGSYRSRFLIRSGQKLIPVSVNDIAYFIAHEKMLFLVRNDAARFVVDYTLDELQTMIDPGIFFRVNRQVLSHLQSVDTIHTSLNGKLNLTLNPEIFTREEVVVSRDRAQEFKGWLDN